MTTQHVYVIGQSGSNTVKIGITANLNRRLGDIQRMSPVPLELLWSHPGDQEMEFGLHRFFAALRSHGEWFAFDSDPVAAVQHAVESEAWKVLGKPKQRTRSPRDRTEELARQKVATDELDSLTAVYTATRAERDRRREELHAAITKHLKARNTTPGCVAEHTPYDRNHIRRIAAAAGVPSLRDRTTVATSAKRTDT